MDPHRDAGKNVHPPPQSMHSLRTEKFHRSTGARLFFQQQIPLRAFHRWHTPGREYWVGTLHSVQLAVTGSNRRGKIRKVNRWKC